MERAQHSEAGGVVAAQDIAASLSCVKTAIMDVLLQIDYIRLQENPRIEADYAVKVGYLENELLEVQVAARRAKRKLTLAQAAANRGVKLQESALEAQLDEEFAEWTRRIEQAVSRFYVLVDYRCGLQALSNAESEELRHLYRMLVKRLHPDVNPEQSEKDTRLFLMAQSAYASGDVSVLRSLVSALGLEDNAEEGLSDAPVLMEAQLAVLEEQLLLHREKLEALKQEFPYKYREKLADAAWVVRRVGELNTLIEEWRAVQYEYDHRFHSRFSGKLGG